MASRNEIDALGRAAGDLADRLATTPAQTLPPATAGRVYKPLGPAGMPVRALHDSIATAIYAGVRAGISGATRAAAAGARLHGADPQGVLRSPRTGGLVAIANGLIGHDLAAEGDPLAIQLSYWQDG